MIKSIKMLVYILSIFLSSFLLFQVQPIVGKFLLPLFGGISSVWSTILLFFQILLTVGYAYAYWLTNIRSSYKQRIIHLILLSISVFFILNEGSSLIPKNIYTEINTQQPIIEIIKLLSISVGIPVLILSSNSILTQFWYTKNLSGKSPYWLFAVSNLGSLLALISYVLFFEYMFTLNIQTWFWKGFYLVFALVVGYVVVQRNTDYEKKTVTRSKTKKSQKILWVMLSATASILLLATTSRLTQEVAPVPLLWVIPLVLYLLSFIMSFSDKVLYNRSFFTFLLTFSSIALLFDLDNNRINFVIRIIMLSVFLYSSCMVLHGELYKIKPKPENLSEYYLFISFGGALGSIFVNLIAPLIFNDYWEFQIGWILTFFLLSIIITIYPSKEFSEPWQRFQSFLIKSFTILVLLHSANIMLNLVGKPVYQERSFYGVSKVYFNEKENYYQYKNGSTIHGLQFVEKDKNNIPTTYFWHDSGIGNVIRNHPAYENKMNVGVMGLGIGTLASYGLTGDNYRFYEIDPVVIDLANGKGSYFSYINNSLAEVEIISGDARISLENELARGEYNNFDLLVMDAFSSDSIPTHLITLEAFEMYMKHMSSSGIIAINATN